MKLPSDLLQPPPEFSLMPFWFWNDELKEDEILRQIQDFERHGVYGFVIHPRVGLPRTLGWMSDRLLSFYRVALEEAARRKMKVMLYDEGMYPSGSSSGQVVAANPAFACRGLAKIELTGDHEPALSAGWNFVARVKRCKGQEIVVVDRPVGSFIRGLHYIDEESSCGSSPSEDQPPAADLLNPAAVACFLRLVYDRFYEDFREYFGKTLFAIFTDEPSLLGRGAPAGVVPGTAGILDHVNESLGYDFTPHLPALWYDDEPDAARYRADYRRAIQARMEWTYYRQLRDWCDAHGVALTGHPDQDDAMGLLRYFQMPGQDLVWRYVEPDKPSALEGKHAVMAKCSSSAMIRLGRRRNVNEFCGAYGHQLTFGEMKWLADWCLVRGVNLLVPHAFYYSVRGPRFDERPPDVGPHSAWWERFQPFADYCRRLCWLNTDGAHVCAVAILSKSDSLSWQAAKVLQQNQIDFNYLEECELMDRATVDADGIRVGGMTYQALVLEYEPESGMEAQLREFERSGRVIRYDATGSALWLAEQISKIVPADVRVSPPTSALRVRHVRKDGLHAYMLFNEGREPIQVSLEFSTQGETVRFDAATGQTSEWLRNRSLRLAGHELQVVMISEPSFSASASSILT